MAFIKHFEALQRSVKIKIKLNFFLIHFSEMHPTLRVYVVRRSEISNLQ